MMIDCVWFCDISDVVGGGEDKGSRTSFITLSFVHIVILLAVKERDVS